MPSANRDDNRVPSLVAKSDAGESVVVVEADPSTKRLKVNATLSGGSLVTSSYDYIEVTEDVTTDVFEYKTGGSGGTTVATVTVTYTDSTKLVLDKVART